jgi:2-polyprenyl-3-methyl-5-hydroxy-6-metoxy-1,4-benzoquinol methylase
MFSKKIYRKIKKTLLNRKEKSYDFNASNPLGGNGERVDIQLNKEIDFDSMDIYQKNHWKRYEFAKDIIDANDICGDFACGTGYGSILMAEKTKTVIGADLNKQVIQKIRERYNDYSNVHFLNENLLNLSYTNYFDSIISFETLEHFEEEDLKKLLLIFNTALKEKGRLIFSTPYMQEQSEEAMKMGFHLTFYINEEKIRNWLEEAGFQLQTIKYQNYDTHIIENDLTKKEFIICVAGKQIFDA